MNYKLLAGFLSAGLVACQAQEIPATPVADDGNSAVTVPYRAQTTPTVADGANDPAIWINGADPAASLILGAGGEGGLEIYALDGSRAGRVEGGAITLVDVRDELVVAYDVAASTILAYSVNAAARTLDVYPGFAIATGAELEGLCLYRSRLTGKTYAFGTGDGMLVQWELYKSGNTLAARETRTVPVGLGAGHCVAHDDGSAVYFSHETLGVFKINAEPESEAEMHPVDLAEPFGHFAGDVKGIAIYEFDDGAYLLVSDADVSRLQVYELESLQHAGTVRIDGVEESEGMAATALNVGSPGGILVVTDDDNGDEATNYKIVEWSAIADALDLRTADIAQMIRRPKRTAVTVSPSAETEPVRSFGDAADDPAIWVHPTDPELSLIIGSQKKRGINVYDLSGKLIQSRADGRINNVDLRSGFQLGERTVTVVTGSNRSTDSISTYIIDEETRTLVDVADGMIDTGMSDPYGLCMYRSPQSGLFYVFVNDTDGLVRQWQLDDAGNGKIRMRVVREFRLDSQTEGCVADDDTGDLYIGEENVGIWKYAAEPDGGEARTQVDSTDDAGNLTADVEGLAIYYGRNGSGYLVASNQGADNYALYERSGDNAFIGIFHVVANEANGIDGISETDGLDVSSAYLGPDYPQGIFVAQDGRNISPAEPQNFKLVPWHQIRDAMNLD